MLTRGIWRTTTFRLTLLFGAVFAAGIVLLLGLVYIQTAGYLTHRVDRALIAEADILSRAGPESIQRRFQREAARDPLSRFGLYASTGEQIAGDSRLTPVSLPLDGRPRDLPPQAANAPARALAVRTPWGQVLVVERDTRQLVELRKIILGALLWSGASIVILGLISSLALSVRPLNRIRAMQLASDNITAGDFSLRLPLHNNGDELDELARITNRMMDEAERLMAQARTVGEGVAHELRTPLTRLRALLEHACEGCDPDDPRRGLLDQCVAETDGVLARFRALLRIAALEARSRQEGLAAVSLALLIDQIVELYEPVAAEREVTLTRDIKQPFWVRADGELLFEALSNLVDNALKFTPAGGRVSLRAAQTASGMVLEVADNGPGIAEAERALVTKRFYRSQRAATIQGYGLGLSVVAAIADFHGFDLAFDDAHPGAVVRVVCHGAWSG